MQSTNYLAVLVFYVLLFTKMNEIESKSIDIPADGKIAESIIVPELESLIRVDRTINVFDDETPAMCSEKMTMINRAAKFTAVLLVNYEFRRRERSVLGLKGSISSMNPGVFCEFLWQRLIRVDAAVDYIEDHLIAKIGEPRVDLLRTQLVNLKELLQEQMNMHGVNYEQYKFNTNRMKSKSKSIIRNKAEAMLDQVVSSLESLSNGCKRLERLYKRSAPSYGDDYDSLDSMW